jgi:DMSO/TMAO reductase YedYZ molybdopterin-dependent catalytic subunit
MTSRTGFSGWWGALCGLLAAAAAMGIGQLFAGFTVPAASPVVAVGEAAIDHTPLFLKEWATSTFGTADKTVLLGGVLVVVFLYSMAVGALAMRRLSLGYLGLAIFAALGLAAALTRHDATGSYSAPTLFGAAAGALALRWLVLTARRAALAGQAQRAARSSLTAGRLPTIGFDPIDRDVPAPAHEGGSRDGEDSRDSRVGTADAGRPRDDAEPAAAHGADTAPAADETAADEEDDGDSLGWVAAGGTASGGSGSGSGSAAGGPGSSGPGIGGSRERDPWAGRGVPLRAGPPAARQAGPVVPAARRQFLVAAGVTVAAAVAGEYAGRSLATRKNVSTALRTLRFPKAADPVPPLPRGVNLNVPGISSFITPNSSFYRVDTAIIVPEVDPANWTLRIHGMVAREITIDFNQLLRRPLIEDYITLTCVSDPVEGPYVGNAKWLGASLAALIRAAGPRAGADQLLCTSVDGFTSGTPLQVVLDGRDALVAVAMNGTALPVEHGFPARLVVPGLYGYVSACKWVVDIEVTTFAAAQAYWVPRGWSQLGPIKTESRIDVPTDGTSVKPGPVPVAGVAWAQHKGIEAVEVRVDKGTWHEARLATVPGIDTWRQWVWDWDAVKGTHLIEARATDKTGYTQTSLVVAEAPNGASGYPSTQVSVS